MNLKAGVYTGQGKRIYTQDSCNHTRRGTCRGNEATNGPPPPKDKLSMDVMDILKHKAKHLADNALFIHK